MRPFQQAGPGSGAALAAGSGAAPASGSGAAPAAEEKADSEADADSKACDKATIEQVRKAQGQWDRKRRDWLGAVELSKSHGNTVGSKIQTDLEALIKQGGEIDGKLLAVEAKYVSHTPLLDADIDGAGSMATKLAEVMKLGAKKAQGLRSMVKY